MLIGAAKPGDNDMGPLQGTWTMAVGFVDGKAILAGQDNLRELVIEDTEYRSKVGDQSATATIKVDSSRTPKEIDFTYTEGEQKGTTVKGIYKLSSGDLVICRGQSEKDARPLEFVAPVGSGLSLVTWTRPKAVETATTNATEEELKRLGGTWRFLEEEVEGTKIPKEVFAKDTLILNGQHFTSFVAGKRVNGVFKIDLVAKPKSIDITFSEGPGKGQTHKGIYELKGDTQKFCIAGPNKPRPDAFVSKPLSGHIVQVMERVKP